MSDPGQLAATVEITAFAVRDRDVHAIVTSDGPDQWLITIKDAPYGVPSLSVTGYNPAQITAARLCRTVADFRDAQTQLTDNLKEAVRSLGNEASATVNGR